MIKREVNQSVISLMSLLVRKANIVSQLFTKVFSAKFSAYCFEA